MGVNALIFCAETAERGGLRSGLQGAVGGFGLETR